MKEFISGDLTRLGTVNKIGKVELIEVSKGWLTVQVSIDGKLSRCHFKVDNLIQALLLNGVEVSIDQAIAALQDKIENLNDYCDHLEGQA